MKIHQDPKKCQDIFWHQQYFLTKINSSPMQRKLRMCQCSTFINRQWYQKATGNQLCWVPNPKQGVATVTMETKRTWFSSITHVPKTQEPSCVFLTPYLARQVSNSWHMQYGLFLHERKGKVNWCVHHCWKQCCWIHFSAVQFCQKWLRQHMTSVFDLCKDWTKLF